jgi:hypothetical protein
VSLHFASEESRTSEVSCEEVVTKTAPFQTHMSKPNKIGAKAPDSSSIAKQRKLTPPDPAQVQAFGAWYAIYPKRVGQKPALRAWLKLNPDLPLVKAIMAATARYANIKADGEARFVLDPAKWINEERWTDEIPISNGNGHAKPVQVKDLGDGMVEVDGLKMTRETYERKYARAAT